MTRVRDLMRNQLALGLMIVMLSFFFAEGGCSGGSGDSREKGEEIVEPSTLPSPWEHQDIGTGMSTGSAGYDETYGVFTLSGAGELIDPFTSDQMHFVYQPVNGDFIIEARVASLNGTDLDTRAGLMIRESLASNSALISHSVSLESILRFGLRPTTGATFYANGDTLSIPVYLRLERTGNIVSESSSTDGVNWTYTFFNESIAMDDPVYVGMYVMSASPEELSTATFDNVRLTSNMVEVNITLDDPADRIYSVDDGLAWKGSFSYNPTSRMITHNGSWSGPFPMLYDDGGPEVGGHEPIGAVAGDGIWGVRVWASNTIGQSYEYGMIRGSVDGSDGPWIWTGPNGTFTVIAGSTTPIHAVGMVVVGD